MLVAIREGIRGCLVAVTMRIFLFVCGRVHPRTRDMDTGTLEKELFVGEASLLHGSRVPLALERAIELLLEEHTHDTRKLHSNVITVNFNDTRRC
jgi:hypothetical protein